MKKVGQMNVLVVDDHVLFRQGLVSLLTSEQEFKVIGEAGSVLEAVEKTRSLCPDMILMDFSLPDGTGVDAAHTILSEMPDTKIIFLTVHAEEEMLIGAVRCGAKGYLLKNVPVTQLKTALRSVQKGEAAISPTMMAQIMHEMAMETNQAHTGSNILDSLSSREMEVLGELTTGATNQEIAKRLVISANTVRHHIHSMLTKLHMENRRQLAKTAELNGIRGHYRVSTPHY